MGQPFCIEYEGLFTESRLAAMSGRRSSLKALIMGDDEQTNRSKR